MILLAQLGQPADLRRQPDGRDRDVPGADAQPVLATSATASASSRLSRFASGSPMPMTTMCVSAFARRGQADCGRAAAVRGSRRRVRLRTTPSSPLAQKTQPMPQPTCVLMQAVRRSASWNQHALDQPGRRAAAGAACACRRRNEVPGDVAAERPKLRGQFVAQIGRADRSSARTTSARPDEQPAAHSAGRAAAACPALCSQASNSSDGTSSKAALVAG